MSLKIYYFFNTLDVALNDDAHEDLQIGKKTFSVMGDEALYMSPASKNDLFATSLVGDDNFAVGMRILSKANENIRVEMLFCSTFYNCKTIIRVPQKKNIFKSALRI